MDAIYEHRLRVRFYEVDYSGFVKPTALFNYMQDAAASHVRQLGIGVSDLKAYNLTWVISRFHLRLMRYPRGNDTITIRTWPATLEGLFSCREFLISDEDGNDIAVATSSWAAVNLASRRPVRLKDHLPDFPLLPQRAIEDDFPSLAVPDGNANELFFQVRRSDLDINRHVNNAVYVDWALETVPVEIAEKYRLVTTEVGFRGEAFYGDTVICRCAVDAVSAAEIVCLHQILKKENGKELTRVRTLWRSSGDS
jgi:acyl-ACP thioesterase